MIIASTFPATPFTDPVLITAVAMAVFLLVPLLFERLSVPGIIGLVVAGAALGPHGFGILERDRTIVLLGTVGLLYLMLMVGLELDLHDFARYRRRSVVFGLASALIPGVVGTAAAPCGGVLRQRSTNPSRPDRPSAPAQRHSARISSARGANRGHASAGACVIT